MCFNFVLPDGTEANLSYELKTPLEFSKKLSIPLAVHKTSLFNKANNKLICLFLDKLEIV